MEIVSRETFALKIILTVLQTAIFLYSKHPGIMLSALRLPASSLLYQYFFAKKNYGDRSYMAAFYGCRPFFGGCPPVHRALRPLGQKQGLRQT